MKISKKIRTSAIYLSGKNICEKLQRHGCEAFFVGGCVRDALLYPSRVPADIDITTSATLNQMELIFPGNKFVGKSFGVTLIKENGFNFEIATFRKEGKYSNRRHPDSVSHGTLQEDSERRDFTINALYFDPKTEKITDFYSGEKDIQKKILRAVGSAEKRFFEDALRIVRLFRFQSNLNFKIHKETLHAAKELSGGVSLLSKERILTEIEKSKKPDLFFKEFLSFVTWEHIEAKLTVKPKKSALVSLPVNFQSMYPHASLVWAIWNLSNNTFATISEKMNSWPRSKEDEKVSQSLEKLEYLCLTKGTLLDFVEKLGTQSDLKMNQVSLFIKTQMKRNKNLPPDLKLVAKIKNELPVKEYIAKMAKHRSIEEICSQVEKNGLNKKSIGLWQNFEKALCLRAHLKNTSYKKPELKVVLQFLKQHQ